MTNDETLLILSVLRGAYPQFYRGISKKEADATVGLWTEMFTEPYPVVAAAVKALIASDTKGFPPVIGQVKEKIRMLTHPEDMTALEAWSYVAKAIKNGSYHSKEEFEKLPPSVRAVVHSPDQLQEWAGMDVETVQSVVASNFQRSYQTKAKADAEYQALPEDVKAFSKQLADKLGQLEETPKVSEKEAQAIKNTAILEARLRLGGG